MILDRLLRLFRLMPHPERRPLLPFPNSRHNCPLVPFPSMESIHPRLRVRIGHLLGYKLPQETSVGNDKYKSLGSLPQLPPHPLRARSQRFGRGSPKPFLAVPLRR